MSNLSSLIPPNQSAKTAERDESGERSDEETVGRQLMALVRSIEKADATNMALLIGEASMLLTNLVDCYSRRGLLEGDLDKSRKILESSAGNTDAVQRRPNKRPRKAAASSPDGGDSAMMDQSAGAEDEILLLSALVRILGGHRKLDTPSDLPVDDGEALLSLISLASGACMSIAEHAGESETLCAQAEREILFRVGKSLLVGWANTLASLVTLADNRSSGHEIRMALPMRQTICSCLRASTSLVALFGNKLSRSVAVLKSLEIATWRLLVVDAVDVQQSASKLLAALPLAGADKKEAAVSWSDNLEDVVSALSTMVATVFPVTKRTFAESGLTNTDAMENRTAAWTALLGDVSSDEQDRAHLALLTLRGLTFLICEFLAREGYNMAGKPSAILLARVNVLDQLTMVQQMISLPSAAESLFYSTKSRLRLEQMEGGVLSISAVTLWLANPVKAFGHDILDYLMRAVGGSRLLPFGRRIIRMSHSSLLASSSFALRKVLDPVSNLRVDKKRKRWLHASVFLRTKTIRSFRLAVEAFGSNLVVTPLSSGTTRPNQSSNECVKGIAIVCGCLLEQLVPPGDDSDNNTDDWGSFDERNDHILCACESLAAIMGATGAYLPLGTRSLVDSVAVRCLSILSELDDSGSSLLNDPYIKTAVLRFGSLCVSTPWPDGAMSDILVLLRRAAHACAHDGNSSVSLASLSCLRQCDSLATSRVPPLEVMSRSKGTSTSLTNTDVSAASLMEGLRSARDVTRGQMVAESKDESVTVNTSETTAVPQKIAQSSITALKDEIDGTSKPSVGRIHFPTQNEKVGPGEDVVGESKKEKVNARDSQTGSGESTQLTRPEKHKPAISSRLQESAASHQQEKSKVANQTAHAEDNSDEDIFLPNIVDCDPDHDDS